MRAEAVAKVTRFYPFLSGCGTVANHRVVRSLAGNPTRDAWAKVKGGRLSVSLSDYVGRSAFFVGDLDRKVSAIVDRFVGPGEVVADIGANLGLVTLRLAKRVGRNGTVHAFEPNPAMAERLRSSLGASNAHNVAVHQVALGERVATLPLFVPDGNAGQGSLVAHSEAASTKVQVVPLDTFDMRRVSFVKIDVEGFEEQVLRGYSRHLELHPPKTILFEQNDASSGSIPLLQDAGYKIHGVAKSLFRLNMVPVNEWSPDFHDYVASLRSL